LNIAANIETVQERIRRAAEKSGRKAEDIVLVAVTKTKPVDMIRTAFHCGVVHFGENRVQEYRKKHGSVDKSVKWHLIGQLQTNKVKYIINNIYLVHSLDREKLAAEMQRQCERADTTIDTLIEVNVSREETKSGLYEEELETFVDRMKNYDRIRVKGLMTIAPYTTETETARPYFALLKKRFDELKSRKLPENVAMTYLSMGMSGDFEAAILEGSNMVRIGSSIFGPRM